MNAPTPDVEGPMTEWVVYCPAHRHWLVRVSIGGTTWTVDEGEAKDYETRNAAREAARVATWLDHNPTAWAIASRPAAEGPVR